MVKYPGFVTLIISIGITWLVSTGQVVEAVGQAKIVPEITPTATPIGFNQEQQVQKVRVFLV